MEDSLRFWKLKEWLSASEVAHLVIGSEPSHGLNIQPGGWRPIYDTLNLAFTKYCHIKYDLREGNINFYEGIFTPDNINAFVVEFDCDEDFEIRQAAIPEWLNFHGIESEYFSSLDNQVKTDVIARPEYQTKLMAIMYATIERYYGENYDSNDSETTPKQTDVIGWIIEKYSISHAKAMAVDKMTRPDKSIYPQG
jgi:hypothetical protein